MRRFLFLVFAVFPLVSACDPQEQEEIESVEEVRDVLSDGGQYRVSYTPLPDPIPPIDLFDVVFLVEDAETGEPVLGLEELLLEVSMPEHNHGMNVEPVLTDLGAGQWEASPLKFHMTGSWQMLFSFQDGDEMDQAVFEVICCESPE